MSRWGSDPVIYELNTAAWLHDIGANAGRAVTLADVPDGEWDRVTPTGVDVVWLMGVWERSPAGVRLALESSSHMADFRATLIDLDESDVIGSAYSVRRYEVDQRFGGRDGLAAARQALAARGVRLLVDFVPNHVAPDHPWLSEHPEYFVQGTPDDVAHAADRFLSVGDAVIARGRDPYFPPWPDVAQLNAFAPVLRQAAIDTLVDIGRQADGVRCDMAMLLLNDVFRRTWGDRPGAAPTREYWSDVIAGVRFVHPQMLFIAEAYWDLEWELQNLGFDYCYDKRLYDRLLHQRADDVRGHLRADLGYQRRLVRFTENHDEPRAANELPPLRLRAAAVTVATLPGATLWHEGQFEGWRVHVPVLLGRRPTEPVDDELRTFHLRLLEAAAGIRRGQWSRCEATGWPDDHSYEQLLAWCWTEGEHRALVVVNDADAPAAARIHLPWDDLAGDTWLLEDQLSGDLFERDGGELSTYGLYVQLPVWGCHVLTWQRSSSPPSSRRVRSGETAPESRRRTQ
jgi:Alpha amylase, catalytic domain